MIEAQFNGVARYPGRDPVATDRAKHLRERNVKVAQAGMQRFLFLVLLLGLRGQAILQVPRLVRERAVLRHQQQSRQQYLQQAAFQHHDVMPVYGKPEQINTRRDGLQNPAQSAHRCSYILLCTVLPHHAPALVP